MEATPIVLHDNKIHALKLAEENGNFDCVASIKLDNVINFFEKVSGTTDTFYI